MNHNDFWPCRSQQRAAPTPRADARLRLGVRSESWPAIIPFRITGQCFDSFDSIVVELQRDGKVGRGEALGVYYLEETPEAMLAQIESVAPAVEAGVCREALQKLLPPGGARNALDCALWDLEAKSSGRTIWQLAGVAPRPLETVFTIGLESTPQQMAAKAAAATVHGLLYYV